MTLNGTQQIDQPGNEFREEYEEEEKREEEEEKDVLHTQYHNAHTTLS